MGLGRFLPAVGGVLLGVLVTTGVSAAAAPAGGLWRPLLKVPGIVDVAGPRADGQLVLSTKNGLFLLGPDRATQAFADGAGGYTAGGGEPYIALAYGQRVWGVSGCSFAPGEVFALDAGSTPGIVRVLPSGRAFRFLDFPPGAFPSGIAFDRFGRFGYRLLVTATFDDNATTSLYAIDCLGHLSVIAQGAPHVEGGIVVAPPTFGHFGGDLIAADENSGRVYAFARDGSVEPVVDSGLPSGGDIGVEALGFVPGRLGPGAAAYLPDLGAPGSPTPGDDSLLVLRGRDLTAASLHPGELVAATEAGGMTIAIDCRATCSVRQVANGLPITHGEGHIAFVAGPGRSG